MISEAELLSLMDDLESDRIERTVSTRDTDKFSIAICGFSNDFPNHRKPGYLLIGVTDRGQPAGLTIGDDVLQGLGSLRSEGNILPVPAMAIQRFPLDGGDVVVIEVQPSDMPPVRYKGRIHIRVGPRRAIASESEERLLAERRTAAMRSFDARPCIGAGLDDMVLDLFMATYRHFAVAPEIIQENHRDAKQQLASLRFFDLKADTPTYAGLLLFGREPLEWMPGAYVQFVRYDGDDLAADVLDEKTFNGDLLTVLRELDAFLPHQITTRPVQDSLLREGLQQEYPPAALRELLMNAIMHRTYESNAPVRLTWFRDRVEIQNPGGLYGMASPENFPSQTDYRNPVVAEAMKTLGFVNRYGRGIFRAQAALKSNGNPPAEFDFTEPTYMLAVIRRSGENLT